MRVLYIRLFSGLLALFCMAVVVTAEEMPEFDGVYLRLQDGSLVSLGRVHLFEHSILFRPENDCTVSGASVCNVKQLRRNLTTFRNDSNSFGAFDQNSGGWLMLNLMMVNIQNDFLPSVSIEEFGSPVSIVVRGRDTQIRIINDLVTLEDMMSRMAFAISSANLTLGSDIVNSSADLSSYYVDNHWGCQPNQYSVRTIDQFTSEYIASESCAIYHFGSASPTQSSTGITQRGIVLAIGNDIYGIRFDLGF